MYKVLCKIKEKELEMVTSDGQFAPGAMEALRDMIAPDDEDVGHVYGSALNPNTLAGKDKKEIAAPNAKVEVKVNRRAVTGGAKEEDLKKAEEEKRAKDPKNLIWDA